MIAAPQAPPTDPPGTSRGRRLSVGDLTLVVAISAVYCLVFPILILHVFTYYAFPIRHITLFCKDRAVEDQAAPVRRLLDVSFVLVVVRWLAVLYAGAPAPLVSLIWTDCGRRYRLLALCEWLPVALMGVFTLVLAVRAKHRWGSR